MVHMTLLGNKVDKYKQLPIETLINTSFRTKNGIDYFEYEYRKNMIKHIKGSFVDQYQELDTKNEHEYVILYDVNKQSYKRIRKNKIHHDMEQYKKPEFYQDIYYIQIYKTYGIFINFIDEYDEDKYIVHVPGENKYRIIKQKVLKTNYARKM